MKNKKHLIVKTSDRGFDCLPEIPSEYGGQVRVYESSTATQPCIWLMAEAPVNLNEPTGAMLEAPIHLTVKNAKKLAQQLMFLVENHYQNDNRKSPDDTSK